MPIRFLVSTHSLFRQLSFFIYFPSSSSLKWWYDDVIVYCLFYCYSFFFFFPLFLLPFSLVYLSRLEYLHSDDEDHDRYDDFKVWLRRCFASHLNAFWLFAFLSILQLCLNFEYILFFSRFEVRSPENIEKPSTKLSNYRCWSGRRRSERSELLGFKYSVSQHRHFSSFLSASHCFEHSTFFIYLKHSHINS